jgi:GNAT superfamily N-acetyltransferase
MTGTRVVDVRRARPDEREALDALMRRSKAHWGYDDAFLEACRSVLVLSAAMITAGDVLVAELDDVVVGVAAVVGERPEVELDVCFVDPPAIGTGVGRALFDAATRLARARGARWMRVESDPNAEPFYARLGGMRIGEVVSDVDPDRRLPVLRFDLGA